MGKTARKAYASQQCIQECQVINISIFHFLLAEAYSSLTRNVNFHKGKEGGKGRDES